MATLPDTITADSVVPMSSILEALEGVLSEEERQVLLSELIDVSPQGVAPGDLITAELFNQILSDINSLKLRVAALEGSTGAPVITGISPQGDIAINTLVTLTGINFNREFRNNTVRIGDVVIRNFRRGDEFSLAFNVPNEFASLPADLMVTLETDGLVSNSVPIRLVEDIPVQGGQFDITTVDTPDGVMQPGQTIVIAWEIAAATLIDDNLTLALSVDNADGATEAEWQAQTRFSPPSPLSISPGRTVTVAATITVPANAVSADLRLVTTRQDGDTDTPLAPVGWRAGQTLEVSSPNASLDFALTGNANGVQEATIDVFGAAMPGLTFTNGGDAEIRFTLQDNRGGNANANYEYSATIETDPAIWPISFGPLPNSTSNLPAGEDATTSIIMNNAGGSAGDLTFLRVEARQTASTAGGQLQPYTSFILIPLQRI
ncbi:MAG: IPT/TIG domain-containing protein [Erythrobacter sp.]|nr:IPT/TIG domain-containing protein [Erythrobacter sp.]